MDMSASYRALLVQVCHVCVNHRWHRRMDMSASCSALWVQVCRRELQYSGCRCVVSVRTYR